MVQPLSQDLRDRVIAAVDGGLSCNAAAQRFGIAASSAIRWVRAWRIEGRATALPQGGDLRSHHIEAYRDVILATTEAEMDITLVELSELLRQEHGASFAPSTVWRFRDRHGLTLKNSGRQRAGATRRRRPAPSLVSTCLARGDHHGGRYPACLRSRLQRPPRQAGSVAAAARRRTQPYQGLIRHLRDTRARSAVQHVQSPKSHTPRARRRFARGMLHRYVCALGQDLCERREWESPWLISSTRLMKNFGSTGSVMCLSAMSGQLLPPAWRF